MIVNKLVCNSKEPSLKLQEHPTSYSAKKPFYSGYFAGKIDPVLCVAGKMKYIVGIIAREASKIFLTTSDNL